MYAVASPADCFSYSDILLIRQLSIAAHKMARKVDHPLQTAVAGAAPSATLIAALENLGIEVCHVYGLTGMRTSFIVPLPSGTERRCIRRNLRALHSDSASPPDHSYTHERLLIKYLVVL